MIELTTNRIKVRASLVPAAAVIPAHQVFSPIVVVKKFLAMVKLVSCEMRKPVNATVDIYVHSPLVSCGIC